MFNCHSCGKEISEHANSCPKCGHQYKHEQTSYEQLDKDIGSAVVTSIGIVILMLIISIVFVLTISIFEELGWVCILASTISLIITLIYWALSNDVTHEKIYKSTNKNISFVSILNLSVIPIVISIILFFSLKQFFPKVADHNATAKSLGLNYLPTKDYLKPPYVVYSVKSPVSLMVFGMILTAQAVAHTNYRRVKLIIKQKQKQVRCPKCRKKASKTESGKFKCIKCYYQFDENNEFKSQNVSNPTVFWSEIIGSTGGNCSTNDSTEFDNSLKSSEATKEELLSLAKQLKSLAKENQIEKKKKPKSNEEYNSFKKIKCPNCASRNYNQKFEIPTELLGSKIECPKCRTKFLAE